MTNITKNCSYVLREIQMMLNDDRLNSGFVTCVIAGRWVQAKVYDEPSEYGVNNGRVSKLAICKGALRDRSKPFHDQMDYAYDRGLEFSNLSNDDVNVFLAALEKLPPAFVKNETRMENP